MLLELAEHLLLQLELLGNGLEHHVHPVQRRRQVALEADPPAVRSLAAEALEDAARELHALLRPLERLLGDVIESHLEAGALKHRAHPRPHGPGADHRGAPQLAHLRRASLVSLIRRHTRSGVNGSSVMGTPASASAVAIAAGVAAWAPSPQPFAP